MEASVAKGNERVYSCYLDELENAAVRSVANANGVAPNAIIRWAVRALLGLPHPDVKIPDDVRALVER
jgi:hypothetical protein